MDKPTVQDIFQRFYPAYLDKYSPSKEMWMDARREDVLDAPYFHVVFTVPDILNTVIYSNQKLLYDTLYHAASDTIRELSADTEHLGAKVGYICILHAWGSEMNFHPHIHTILLGGGLTPENKWKDNGEDFFLPVSVISRMFRGKYMEELNSSGKVKNLNSTVRLKNTETITNSKS